MAFPIPIIGPIVDGISKLGNTWLEGRNQKIKVKAEAEAKVMVKASESVADWEAVQARNSGNSWKDEYITILVSVPMVLAFFPGAVPWVEDGFTALKEMPQWYQYTISVVVASSFGVRTALGFVNAKERIKHVPTK